MLYLLLAFFVPPMLGVLASQHFMAGRKRTGWHVSAVFTAVIIYENVAFRMPFRGVTNELLYTAMGTLTVVLIFMAIPFENQASGRSGQQVDAHPSVALVYFLLPVASFTLVGRVVHAQQIAARFAGVVIESYHSHHAASIIVKQADGSAVTVEDVERTTWDRLVPGRSHLAKSAWSVYGELDGRPVRVVHPAKVMFLGPFPD